MEGYTKYEGSPDHQFAKFLRTVEPHWDYEQCGTHTIFYKPHPTEKAKYETIAVVSYDNRKCTKTVNIPNKHVELFERMVCHA